MVFQNYALYPHMTVEQNLAFGLKLRKMPKAEINKRVGEAAKMLGLEQYLKRKPAALSGGQRQRVAMGRAIVREPQAFLMDEPLSNLDAKLRVSMRASLNQLHERLGVTTVYVTHDQVEAMTLGDRVCVLREGMLQQVDTPQNLFDNPVNLFVAGFIGSPAMNFVTAELVRDGADGARHVRRLQPAGARRGDLRRASPAWTTTSAASSSSASAPPTSRTPRPTARQDWARIRPAPRSPRSSAARSTSIFAIDAPPVEHKDTADLAQDADEDERGDPAGRRQGAVDRPRQRALPRPARPDHRAGRRHRQPALLRPGTGLAIGHEANV